MDSVEALADIEQDLQRWMKESAASIVFRAWFKFELLPEAAGAASFLNGPVPGCDTLPFLTKDPSQCIGSTLRFW